VTETPVQAARILAVRASLTIIVHVVGAQLRVVLAQGLPGVAAVVGMAIPALRTSLIVDAGEVALVEIGQAGRRPCGQQPAEERQDRMSTSLHVFFFVPFPATISLAHFARQLRRQSPSTGTPTSGIRKKSAPSS
jgi:hypothetical protein